jgi:2-oxoglutarate dehydrogenase E2 component (dihydrolipoamide succinyltransferase)
MPVEIKVPNMGESVVEATVAQWLKKPGDSVKAGEDLVELETEKVNQSIQAESDGVLTEVLKQAGETVAVGDVLAVLGENGAAPATAPAPATDAPAATPPAPAANGADVKATPTAEAMAAQHGVNLKDIKPEDGERIKKVDVTRQIGAAQQGVPAEKVTTAVQQPLAPPTPVTPPAQTAPAQPAPAVSTANGRPEERIKLTRRREAIARNLVLAQQTAAMLTTFNEVDMTAVMEVRKRRKEAFEQRFGVGLGFMSFFTKAVIGALKAFPTVNAELQGNELVLKKYYDIGIAVGVEEGLVVPVIRDADKLTFAQIEKGIKELAVKAKDGKLSLAELTGGTFTITNGGVYGSLMSTPILNYPQVGILGMHTIKERPIVVGGEIVARPMMYLAFSYDHRVIDGSTAVRFLVKIKDLIEDPESLLLEG